MSTVTSLHSTINILIKTEYEEGDPEKRFHAQGCVDQWIPHVPHPKMCQKILGSSGTIFLTSSLKIDYATDICKLTHEYLFFAHKYLAGRCNLKVYVCMEISQ